LAFIDEQAAGKLDGVNVEPRDVLLNITGDGETIARCCVVPDDVLPARVSQHVMILRPTEELVPEFLQRYLSHPRIRVYMLGHNSGGSRRALTKRQVENFEIVVPPVPEQYAIAGVLKALDDKITTNENATVAALELAKCHYIMSTGPGTITRAIGAVAEIFDGPHATPEKTETGPWFLSISSLSQGRLTLRESAHLSEENFARWTRRVTPRAGDILFSYETRLGEAALMPAGVHACLGRRMALLRPRQGTIDSRVLLQAYLSSGFQRTIRQRAVHGATVDRIPLTELSKWPISFPERGVEKLAQILTALDDRASANDRENEVLAELRDVLLSKLLSGQIRVRDAERVVEEAT